MDRGASRIACAGQNKFFRRSIVFQQTLEFLVFCQHFQTTKNKALQQLKQALIISFFHLECIGIVDLLVLLFNNSLRSIFLFLTGQNHRIYFAGCNQFMNIFRILYRSNSNLINATASLSAN